MKKAYLVLVIFLIGTLSNVHGLVVMNDIIPVFPPEEQKAIEDAVITGAVHFLQARSQVDMLLAEYEKSGKQAFNFDDALAYAASAAAELEKSIAAYDQAVSLGKKAGYVDEVVQKFKTFAYDACASEKQLDNDIMVEVKAYFSGGNIVGAYQQNIENLGEILLQLQFLKEKIEARQIPGIALTWKLLQQCSYTTLFGNYCTVIATAVLAQ